MDKINKIQKYTKILGFCTGILIIVNGINAFFMFQNMQKNEQIIDGLTIKNTPNQKTDYNLRNATPIDYSLALLDIFNTKLNFLYVDINPSIKKSGIEEYIGDKNSNIFISSKLTGESKNKYNELIHLASEPISEKEEEHAREVLLKAIILYENIHKYEEISESFKKIFLQNMTELNILVGIRNPDSVKILNIYRKNLSNKEFQELVRSQETEKLWDIYFKNEFGEKISSVAYLQDGTYYQKGNKNDITGNQ